MAPTTDTASSTHITGPPDASVDGLWQRDFLRVLGRVVGLGLGGLRQGIHGVPDLGAEAALADLRPPDEVAAGLGVQRERLGGQVPSGD